MLTSEKPRTKSFRDAGSRIFQQEAETGDGIIQLQRELSAGRRDKQRSQGIER